MLPPAQQGVTHAPGERAPLKTCPSACSAASTCPQTETLQGPRRASGQAALEAGVAGLPQQRCLAMTWASQLQHRFACTSRASALAELQHAAQLA